MRNNNSQWLLIIFVVSLLSFATFAQTYKVIKVGYCRATAYSSEKKQTDNDPFSTASGTRPKWGTVAANHLPFWTRLKIKGFGEKIFVVEDRHAKRFKNRIDIWFPTRKEAIKFGNRQIKYWVVKNVRPLPD
ncbi:MAG: 3D domain-containing protein [bacterium]